MNEKIAMWWCIGDENYGVVNGDIIVADTNDPTNRESAK